MSSDLHGEIAGEAIRAFDDDHAHAVASDPIHHRLEAWPLAYRVRARHRRVIEAVLVGPDAFAALNVRR